MVRWRPDRSETAHSTAVQVSSAAAVAAKDPMSGGCWRTSGSWQKPRSATAQANGATSGAVVVLVSGESETRDSRPCEEITLNAEIAKTGA